MKLHFTPAGLQEIRGSLNDGSGQDFVVVGKATISALLDEAFYARELERAVRELPFEGKFNIAQLTLRPEVGRDDKC